MDVSLYSAIKRNLYEVYNPYQKTIASLDSIKVINAIRSDKKALSNSVKCILTQGPGKMERIDVSIDEVLKPIVHEFLVNDII